MTQPTKISDAGIALIQRFEGLRLTAYPDPGTGGKPWTIGYGHTGSDVYPSLTITKERAEAILRVDLDRFERGVAGLVGEHPTTQHEFDALVALGFNIGLGNLGGSTLLKLHNVGSKTDARLQFSRWNKAAGHVMDGLTKRRAAEAQLYGAPNV